MKRVAIEATVVDHKYYDRNVVSPFLEASTAMLAACANRHEQSMQAPDPDRHSRVYTNV